jgi:hypothetical protein
MVALVYELGHSRSRWVVIMSYLWVCSLFGPGTVEVDKQRWPGVLAQDCHRSRIMTSKQQHKQRAVVMFQQQCVFANVVAVAKHARGASRA